MIQNYDAFTKSVDLYPDTVENTQLVKCMSYALGLTGEAGEVANKVKKWHRDSEVDVQSIIRELGDCLWYITRMANTLGYTIDSVAVMNQTKLLDRQNRGVIQGNGDTR
jgi:NTP pyrophosphatase (non-canonical NTP hydrolase)